MSSENIPHISRRAATPYTHGVKKGKADPAPKLEEKEVQSAAPVKDQIDIRGPQEKEEAPELVSAEDMARYLKMIKESPDSDPDKVARAKEKLEGGHYGQEAIDGTIDGILDDLFGV